MECIFDKEKLGAVLLDFYNSTGIAITLYDSKKTIVATLPCFSEYCAFVREGKSCLENCNRSDLMHMKEVSSDRGTHTYSCHAGIVEMILPIEYEGVLIAYLQIGQFRDGEEIYSKREKIIEAANKYGIDESRLLELYSHLPVVNRQRLKALSSILEILIRSFWVDGLITYKRSMLSVRIDQYVTERVTEKIYISELTEKFFLSKNALYRLFREEFGTTVNEFILSKRLELARALLSQHDSMNVTEVASRSGFSDYNYFIRIFKKHYGTTPLKYRKKSISTHSEK